MKKKSRIFFYEAINLNQNIVHGSHVLFFLSLFLKESIETFSCSSKFLKSKAEFNLFS